jgi:hypothetical protein
MIDESTEIHAAVLDIYYAGRWRVMRVTQPGMMEVATKNGPVEMPFYPGDVLLADAGDRILCGPVSLDGAIELARRILDNDVRARTDPLAILILSTALAGFTAAGGPDLTNPQSDAPAIPAEAQDAGAVL